MKSILLLYIQILIPSLSVFAQDYQVVRSDRIAFFKNEFGNIRCLKIDSVNYSVDSVFYPLASMQQIDYDCFTPYSGSWIGHEIIIQDNGNTTFINYQRDSVKIKPNSILNESWTAYEFPDSSIVIAKMIALDTLGIFGHPDTVKTIEFRVYDQHLNPVDHHLNARTIILSKSYGLVKTLNFSNFPDPADNYNSDDQLQEYELTGLSAPQVGIQNLSWIDVNDFQTGDEIHVSYESSTWWDPEFVFADSKKTIYKYLLRTDFDDSIVYRVEIIQSHQKTEGQNLSSSYSHDTIDTIIKPKPLFDKLPGELMFSGDVVSFNSMDMHSTISKTEPSVYTTFHQTFDSCWSNCCYDGCFTANTYIKGLGGPYYECTNFMAGGGIENKMVYYKKGGDIWGYPLVITSVQDHSIQFDVEIYPNPAKDFISIEIQNCEFPIRFELFDMEGKVASVAEIISGSSTLKIQNLNPGIYVYRFSNEDKIYNTGKMIIE